MGFPVTVILGGAGRIGRVLRQCWPTELSQTAQLRWQARRLQMDALPQEDWVILDPLLAPDALVQALVGAETVLCLAGSIPGRSGDLADNTRLALAAIEAAAQVRSRGQVLEAGRGRVPKVILVSSAAVYGDQAGLLRECDPVSPVSAYGQAKYEMEQQALARGRELGVQVCILRIGNIAGLDVILGNWKPGSALDQFADGRSPRRSYIGVRTLARVLAVLLQQPVLPPLLNIAQPGSIDMADLLQAAGHEVVTRPAPETAIPEVIFDLTLLHETLPCQDMPSAAEPICLIAEWSLFEPGFLKNDLKDTD